LINYPSNPTGISYTKKELKDLCKVILKHNLLIISDEVYDELTYDYNHIPIPTLGDKIKEHVIYLNGFSKAFAMTGWRVGYVCGNKEIVAAIVIVVVVVVAFFAVRSFLTNGFDACMNSCQNSPQLEHLKCKDYCEELAHKGIIVIELPK